MEETKVIAEDITKLAEKWKGKKGNLIMVLHEMQNRYGYVPREAAIQLSQALDVPLARIYEVITFYSYFKLTPPGKFTVSVCLGTACYLKGAADILKEISNVLKIEEGETTPDGLFHLEVVRCLGCCGLAPVLSVNGTMHGNLKKEDIAGILAEYKAKAGA